MAALLAGLDVEVVAIAFLFAVLVGVLILRPLLVALFGQAPFIGGWLASNVDTGLGNFERSLQAPAAAALGLLTSTIDWLTYQYTQLLATLTGFGQLVVTAAWKIQNLVVPAAEQAATNAAINLVGGAEASLRAEIAGAEALAAADLAAAQAAEQAAVSAALAEAVRLVDAGEALSRGLFAVAEQDAAALAEAGRAFVIDQIGGVEAEIQAAFNRAVAITTAAESALQGDIGAVERQVLGTLQGEVDALLKQIAADKAAISAALTGSLAGVLADIAAIRALRCIQRCSELGALGDALQIITLAEIMGLIEMILHQPDDFRSAWMAGVQPLVASTVATVRQGLGV